MLNLQFNQFILIKKRYCKNMQLQTSEQCAQAEVSVPHSKSGILQYDRNNLQLKTSNILKHATNTNEKRSNMP